MAREKKLHSKKKNERYFMIRLYIVMTFIMLIKISAILVLNCHVLLSMIKIGAVILA